MYNKMSLNVYSNLFRPTQCSVGGLFTPYTVHPRAAAAGNTTIAQNTPPFIFEGMWAGVWQCTEVNGTAATQLTALV